MEEQITETGTDGLAAPSADELRAVEEISEEALADAENAAETGDITDSLGLYLRESGRRACSGRRRGQRDGTEQDDRGKSAAVRLDRQALCKSRSPTLRSYPGGESRFDAGRAEV